MKFDKSYNLSYNIDEPDLLGGSMSKLKVRKVGNSLGVILPKEVQSALNVTEGDVIEFTSLENGTAILDVPLPHHSKWVFSKSAVLDSGDQDWLDANLEEEDDEVPAW